MSETFFQGITEDSVDLVRVAAVRGQDLLEFFEFVLEFVVHFFGGFSGLECIIGGWGVFGVYNDIY